jgi:hypothetical protein
MHLEELRGVLVFPFKIFTTDLCLSEYTGKNISLFLAVKAEDDKRLMINEVVNCLCSRSASYKTNEKR